MTAQLLTCSSAFGTDCPCLLRGLLQLVIVSFVSVLFFSQEELICLPGTVGSVTVGKKAQTKQSFLVNDKSIGCGQFLINRTQSHIKEGDGGEDRIETALFK
jgi:hypothetical protein